MIPLKSATRWLSIANGFCQMLFILPVVVLFYEYKGLSIGDFFLIQGLHRLFIFVIEVPTGYIGDIFSRKQTVLMGFFIHALGYLCWIFGYGFWFILAGELLFAMALGLISGTLEAYLYDLLKKRHKEEKYHLKLAKMETIGNASLMFATLTGAFVYQFFGPVAPVWAGVVCVLICVSICALLPDVPESKRIVAAEKSKMQDILDISKFAMKHPEIKWLMIFPGVYGTLTLVFWWGLQPVMIEQNVPIFMFSFVVGLGAFMRTFWSALSGKALDKFKLSGVIKILWGIIIVASVAAVAAVYVPAGSVYICLFLMIMGTGSIVLAKVATSVLVNHRIQSDERATVLSVKNMVDKAATGLGMVCLKPLFDGIGMGPTFMVSSLVLLPIILWSACHLYKMHLK